MPETDFSNRLQRLMRQRSLSRGAVARTVGVSRTAVAGWLVGVRPRQAHALALARLFNVHVDWLMTGGVYRQGEYPAQVGSLCDRIRQLPPARLALLERLVDDWLEP
ncbi:helix-turn-helix domain-containing protein [Crenobacter caeni]|uniref:Helix-turn-helix transcriptional regulator n=1 Tax=Crenobacter caeni TaxID=2705474 RepID=A0A6B2KNA1_9NEIS|nr:helix-turn-helix transcriptional regulator [Crenobacter caeni]NDV11650.1 helix-turn-helix transcriptional regulator [Crenobacter caeni]